MPIVIAGPGPPAIEVPSSVVSRNLITLPTPSLQEAGAEPVPPEVVRDMLRHAWVVAARLPQPQIHIMNDITMNSEQMHLDSSDYVIVEEIRIDERQRGYSYEYKDVDVIVPIRIHTKNSRQRLYDIMAEIRRIVYTYQRAIRPWQQLYYDNFQETSVGQHLYWQGVCTVRLTSRVVPIITGISTGFETPSRPNAAARVPQRQQRVIAETVEDPEEPIPPDAAGTSDLL